MNEPEQKRQIIVPVTREEDCLKQLVATGAKPRDVLLAMLIFKTPAILRAACLGAAGLVAAYLGMWK